MGGTPHQVHTEKVGTPMMENTIMTDQPDRVSDTAVVFGNAHIIPDVIENITDQVHYGEVRVENGMQLSLDNIATEPEIVIRGAKPADVFSLVMVDPDMPSPHNPKYRDTLYWMVNNIKGQTAADGEFTVEYMPPEPAAGTHRYVFLLYNQQTKFLKPDPPRVRVSFQLKDWAKSHEYGDPVAGVYFKCKHD